MTAASQWAISERAWEMPYLRIGGCLPDPDIYPEYGVCPGDGICEARSNAGVCELAADHPDDLHATTSLSGRIVDVWEERILDED